MITTTIILGSIAISASFSLYRYAGTVQKDQHGNGSKPKAQIEAGWIDEDGAHGFRSGDTHSRLLTALPAEDCPAMGPLLEKMEEAHGIVLCKKIKDSMAKRRF